MAFKNSIYQNRIFDNMTPTPSPEQQRGKAKISSTAGHGSGKHEEHEHYIFNRDAMASARLHLQHQLWVQSTGFLLHPSVPLKERLLVADVGCGTGIWSLELSKQLPAGGNIEAYDLSLAQTLPRQWAPDNVSFNQMDIFNPIPQHLLGRYDVVHLRLFLCVIASGDPMPLLRQLLKLLKPGGHLQWQEYDPTNDKIITAEPSTSAPAVQTLRSAVEGHAVIDWVKTLHTRFAEAGAQLVANERCWTARGCYGIKQDVTFMAMTEWVANLRNKSLGGKNEVADRLERLGVEAEEECWRLGRGSLIDSEMVTWVARKK